MICNGHQDQPPQPPPQTTGRPIGYTEEGVGITIGLLVSSWDYIAYYIFGSFSRSSI